MVLPDQREGGGRHADDPVHRRAVKGAQRAENAKKLIDYLLSAEVESASSTPNSPATPSEAAKAPRR